MSGLDLAHEAAGVWKYIGDLAEPISERQVKLRALSQGTMSCATSHISTVAKV